MCSSLTICAFGDILISSVLNPLSFKYLISLKKDFILTTHPGPMIDLIP